MEGQKQKGRSKRAKVVAKNERVEQEFEGKFFLSLGFFLLLSCVFHFICV
jgi:hypothetical protein